MTPNSTFIFVAKSIILMPLYLWRLCIGSIVYLFTKKTPNYAYQSMVSMHCLFKGWSNDALHSVVRLFRKPRTTFQPLRESSLQLQKYENDFLKEMKSAGFYLFPQRLDPGVCSEIVKFSLSTQAFTKPNSKKLTYDRASPKDAGYYFDEATLLQSDAVQQLLCEADFARLAQLYLQCDPVLTIAMMWWSTTFTSTSDSQQQMAQLFHFDMDRIKWIKFFFYLTDVGAENGPHTIVKRTHRKGLQPWELLQYQYARIPDDIFEQHYKKDDIVELTAPAGTIFAADTRCFHKGKRPTNGDRLVLEFEFSDCLFGANYDRIKIDPRKQPTMYNMMSAYPDLLPRYSI